MKLKKQMKGDFTVVHNVFIRDQRLDLKCRGLLLTMLSLPDGWHFSIRGLATLFPDGYEATQKALKRLEEYGYLKRSRIYENNMIVEWEYAFSDEPIFCENRSQLTLFELIEGFDDEPTIGIVDNS